jgi:hypothetical protein
VSISTDRSRDPSSTNTASQRRSGSLVKTACSLRSNSGITGSSLNTGMTTHNVGTRSGPVDESRLGCMGKRIGLRDAGGYRSPAAGMSGFIQGFLRRDTSNSSAGGDHNRAQPRAGVPEPVGGRRAFAFQSRGHENSLGEDPHWQAAMISHSRYRAITRTRRTGLIFTAGSGSTIAKPGTWACFNGSSSPRPSTAGSQYLESLGATREFSSLPSIPPPHQYPGVGRKFKKCWGGGSSPAPPPIFVYGRNQTSL